METRIIIAGGRGFVDYELLEQKVDEILKDIKEPVIISGGARGADTLGEKYALEHGMRLVRFPADWKKYGKRAGYLRNQEMAEYAMKGTNSILIAFWDGLSRGTNDMIQRAESYGMKVYIIHYEENIPRGIEQPRKGIFWLVEDEIWAFPFIEEQFTLGISKSGDSYVHKKIWRKIKPKSCNHPYNYYPRGRVEITPKGKYIVYMNPNISSDYIPQIMEKFGLDKQPRVIYDNSKHYRSHFDQGWEPDKSTI